MAKASINTGADAQPVHTRTTAGSEESQVVVLGVDGSDVVVDPRDLATQATVAAILAKIIAAPATESTLAAVLAAVDGLEANTAAGASQTTLAALLADSQAKADLSETQPVSAAALPLPSGAATGAKQDTAQTRLDLLATDAKLELVRALLAGTLTTALDAAALAALETTELGATTLAALETISVARGTLGYDAGTATGTVDVPAGARARFVSLIAGASAATLTVNGGDTITVPAGASFDREFAGDATLGGDVVIGGTITSYYVEWVTP